MPRSQCDDLNQCVSAFHSSLDCYWRYWELAYEGSTVDLMDRAEWERVSKL